MEAHGRRPEAKEEIGKREKCDKRSKGGGDIRLG